MNRSLNQSQFNDKKLWAGCIEINSLPPRQEEQYSQIPAQQLPPPQKSWLFNYQGSNKDYYLEFIADRGLKMKMMILEESNKDAVIGTGTVEKTLRRLFPRIVTTADIHGYSNPNDIFWNTSLYEVHFPAPPYLHCNLFDNIAVITSTTWLPMRILIKFTPVHHEYCESVLRDLYSLYQRRIITRQICMELTEIWNKSEHFAVRAFFQFWTPSKTEVPPDELQQIESHKLSLWQILKNSVTNFQSRTLTAKNYENPKLYYATVKSGGGTVMIPSEFGAHFEYSFPFPRTRLAPKNYFKSAAIAFGRNSVDVDTGKPTHSENLVNIGKCIKDANPTQEDIFFDINSLRQSMSIFGLTRTGKTSFLANMLHDIAQSNPHIGQLIFYLKNEPIPFDADLVINGDSPEFKLPYLFSSSDSDIKIEELARYIASGLGLLDNGRRYIINYCNHLLSEGQGFSPCIQDFLTGVLEYLDEPKNRYGTSQGDIFQATKQRIEALIGDRRFCTIFSSEINPEWFDNWMTNGERVILDLRKFNPFIQRFIVLAILQMIREFAKPVGGVNLQALYVIDEAHRLFFKPPTADYYDSDNLGQGALERELDFMINELAICGIGGIFADQNPYKLLDSIRNQIGTTVFFRISREGAQQFSSDHTMQEFLTTMPDHRCWVESNPQEMSVYIAPKSPILPGDYRLVEV